MEYYIQAFYAESTGGCFAREEDWMCGPVSPPTCMLSWHDVYFFIVIIGSIISFSSILQWPYAILKFNIRIYFILPIMLLFFLICCWVSENWNNLKSWYLNLALFMVKLFFKYGLPFHP
jgi:hypothetical protein